MVRYKDRQAEKDRQGREKEVEREREGREKAEKEKEELGKYNREM